MLSPPFAIACWGELIGSYIGQRGIPIGYNSGLHPFRLSLRSVITDEEHDSPERRATPFGETDRLELAPSRSTLQSHRSKLLRLKELARHDAVDYGRQTVSLLSNFSGNSVDVSMIAERQRATECKRRKFMHRCSNELILSVL